MKISGGWEKHKGLIFIIAVFIITRIVYYFYFGIRFDTSPLDFYWQYVDPYLLKTDLLRSVYYLHSQPPLFNLFLGIVLKLSPVNYGIIFGLCYSVLGLSFAVSLFLVMTELGVSDILAVVLTSLFMISPFTVLYENWLFYEYPTAVLLCLSLLFFHRFVSDGKFVNGVILFTLLAFIVLTRSMFHMFWFIGIAIVLILYRTHDYKKVILAFIIPLAIVSSVYAKNLYVFKTFSLGSEYIGHNIARMTTFELPESLRKKLIKENSISPVCSMQIFSSVSAYEPYIKFKKTGIPLLDREYKTTGFVNAHNLAYLDISNRYLHDAFYVARHYPSICLRSLMRYYKKYFLPPSNTWPFNEENLNYMKIGGLDRIFNLLFFGQKTLFFVIVIFILYLVILKIFMNTPLNKKIRLIC